MQFVQLKKQAKTCLFSLFELFRDTAVSTYGDLGISTRTRLCSTSSTGFFFVLYFAPSIPIPLPHPPLPPFSVASLWISHTGKLGLISIMPDLFSIP